MYNNNIVVIISNDLSNVSAVGLKHVESIDPVD